MLLLVIITIIICALLGLIVLIQNPKGGGLSSNFSSSSQLLGVQKTGDILEKGTWILAISLIVLSLAINVIGKTATVSAASKNQEQIDKSSKQSAAPTAAPTQAPAPGTLTLPAKK